MILDWLNSCSTGICDYVGEPTFQVGFILGFLLPLLVWLILWLVYSNRRACHAIVINEAGGDFIFSIAALKSFLKRIVMEFSDMELKEVRLRRLGENLSLRLFLTALPGSDILALRSKLRNRILDEAKTKLGISDKLQVIDIAIDKLKEGKPVLANEAASHSEPVKNKAPLPPLQ